VTKIINISLKQVNTFLSFLSNQVNIYLEWKSGPQPNIENKIIKLVDICITRQPTLVKLPTLVKCEVISTNEVLLMVILSWWLKWVEHTHNETMVTVHVPKRPFSTMPIPWRITLVSRILKFDLKQSVLVSSLANQYPDLEHMKKEAWHLEVVMLPYMLRLTVKMSWQGYCQITTTFTERSMSTSSSPSAIMQNI